jgi:cobalamin biosynthesis protein CobT
MMRNLLSAKASRWDPGQLRGRLDPSSAFRVALGTSKRVFRRQVVSQALDTRAILMVDHSDSMRGPQLLMASKAASLFGESLNSFGVPFAICGYSTSTHMIEGQAIYKAASDADRKIYTRWGGLWIGVYKAFEESWVAVRHRCANMERNQRINTYDGESVRWAALQLMRYPEQRKIMFVFNDGFPCPNVWPTFSKPHETYLSEVLKIVEKHIEVFAIGIKSDAVKRFYSNSATIQNLDDLPKVMIGELDRMLRRNQSTYRSVG